MRKFFLLVFLSCLLSSPVRITVGDPFYLTFKQEVKLPEVFEVLSKERSPEGIKYKLTVFRPGNYMIKAGPKVLYVEVVSVLKGGEELQEIAGPVEVKGSPGWLLLRAGIFLGVVLFILGGVLLYRRLSRRRQNPWRQLLSEAISLKKELLRENLDSFYSRLGYLLRIYLQRKSQIPALSMTAGELAGKVPSELHRILRRADLVRFGGLAVREPHSDLSLLIQLIEEAANEAEQT